MGLLDRRFGACIAASLVASTPALAQHAPQSLFSPSVAAELDGTLEGVMAANNLPSVVVDVSLPKKGRYTFARGAADLETGLQRDERQPFRITSLTKTFVATAVLQLVDRGQLRKTDLLAKRYPDFPNAGKITIDDLLRMRSGIAAPTTRNWRLPSMTIPPRTPRSSHRWWRNLPRSRATSSRLTRKGSTRTSTTTSWAGSFSR